MANSPDTVANAATADPSAPSFERALAELEGIVAAMEAGKMPLQDALDAYKRGVALLRQCQSTLSAAEQQIRILDAEGLREFDATAQRDGTGRGGEQDA